MRALVVSLVLLLSSSASAEPRPEPVVRGGEIVVPGRVQRPAAVFVLERTPAPGEASEIRRSFVEEIIRSVGSQPF